MPRKGGSRSPPIRGRGYSPRRSGSPRDSARHRRTASASPERRPPRSPVGRSDKMSRYSPATSRSPSHHNRRRSPSRRSPSPAYRRVSSSAARRGRSPSTSRRQRSSSPVRRASPDLSHHPPRSPGPLPPPPGRSVPDRSWASGGGGGGIADYAGRGGGYSGARGSGYGAGSYAARGGGRGGGRSFQSFGDDGIRADSIEEYRRLKRMKLWQTGANSIWHNTPSPSPERSRRHVTSSVTPLPPKSALKLHEHRASSQQQQQGALPSSSHSSDESTSNGTSSSSPEPASKRGTGVNVMEARDDVARDLDPLEELLAEVGQPGIGGSSEEPEPRSTSKHGSKGSAHKLSAKGQDKDGGVVEDGPGSGAMGNSAAGAAAPFPVAARVHFAEEVDIAPAAPRAEANGAAVPAAPPVPGQSAAMLAIEQQEADLFRTWVADQKARASAVAAARRAEEEEEVMVGPELPDGGGPNSNRGNYGGYMLPGEGDRMAAYVQSGKRIPRRGEVGLSSEQISNFEQLGYIMSGSRHSRMNAVRIRKENQIYSAEEKAALAMFNYEENKAKEAKVLEDMKRLVNRTLAVEGGGVQDGDGGAGSA